MKNGSDVSSFRKIHLPKAAALCKKYIPFLKFHAPDLRFFLNQASSEANREQPPDPNQI